jgi:environmental stress-induced protein Ves
MSEAEIDALAAAFQSGALPKAEWTHQAHLRVGAWHIRRFGKDAALVRMRAGIRRLNAFHHVPDSESRGYHETVTRSYLHFIAEFFRQLPPGMPFDQGVARLLASPVGGAGFLFAFYSRDVLMSSRARLQWVQPDLHSFDWNSCRMLRASELAVTSWKNGEGWTSQVAIFPADAALDNFDWRVSVAGSGRSGAFSSFPGVDRTLAVLAGRVQLTIAGRESLEIGADSAPVSFSGDLATTARLVEAPLLDLNVMTRRGLFVHRVERRTLEPGAEVALTSMTNLVFSIDTRDVQLCQPLSRPATLTCEGGDVFVIGIDYA